MPDAVYLFLGAVFGVFAGVYLASRPSHRLKKLVEDEKRLAVRAVRSATDQLATRLEQREHELAQFYAISRRFPKSEIYGLTSQLRRSAVPIAANIAEGHARSTRREYAHFCFTARGSLAETRCLLRLAEDLGYLQPDDYGRLIELCDTVGKMLNALVRFLRS